MIVNALATPTGGHGRWRGELKARPHAIVRTALIGLLATVCAACDGSSSQPQPSSSATNQSLSATRERDEAIVAVEQYLATGNLPEAKAILMVQAAKSPDDPLVQELLGQVYAAEGLAASHRGDKAAAQQFREQAWGAYRIAAEAAPREAGLQHAAGMMALAAGHGEEALVMFTRAEQADGANPQFPLFVAQVLLQLKRVDEADAAIDRALALAPREPTALATRAIIRMEQQRFDEAEAAITAARAASPDDGGLRVMHARVLRRAGKPQRAIELLAGLSDLERAHSGTADELGLSFRALGEHVKAANAWDHLLRGGHVPLDERWMYEVKIAESMLDAGHAEAARLWLEQARLAAPTAVEVTALDARLKNVP